MTRLWTPEALYVSRPTMRVRANRRTGLILALTSGWAWIVRGSGEHSPSGREESGNDGTRGFAAAPRRESASSPPHERAIQFFEPLIDFRPSRLFSGDLRRRF